MGILRILLAIVIPPLGVFLTVGPSSALIINILLTILGWLPGSIHAVWVITKHAERTDVVAREEAERVDERVY
ncbi:YqaE/Pmp3 family membrane protein [Limnoraphis robusta]|uniref:YqaE/Pmp3 family membrane protein n=1 Tax=Limnoraphis robusta TaxID=1118279 RepID=UPI002B1E96ED|nr:YqaE/Pmp3 family membrane protein [Limnoraphis robusta]MEA5496884.1 YqaE/Pmp3 family membrane protein [Limnoraphis robusta BA-68 BA1]